jgi:hypothetical protein
MELDDKTLETIADLICGDNYQYYRKGRDLNQYFLVMQDWNVPI